MYCVFFFLEPYYRHSVAHWIGFGAFFVCFLALYFGIEHTEDRRQNVFLAIMFALCLGYLWRNPAFWGATIFPIVIAGYMVPRMLAFLGILGGVCAAMLLQRWHLGLEFWPVFLIASIGISNLAFAREQRHNRAMKRAQHEIEHLAATAERERIARDLHDLLGHTLTLITLKAELANRILPIDPQRAQQEMRDVETTARKALAEVREAVLGVGAVNFAAEVARAQTAFAAAEIEAEIHFDDVVLSTQMEQVLCLALREAVTNILRHAAARSVTIALLKRDGRYILVLRTTVAAALALQATDCVACGNACRRWQEACSSRHRWERDRGWKLLCPRQRIPPLRWNQYSRYCLRCQHEDFHAAGGRSGDGARCACRPACH